jgi:glycosyltransferase involved in cell wall biosynthesis
VIAGRNVREYLENAGFSPMDLQGIVFTGFVEHEELPKLLSLADVFVLPSFYESYAMALVEAMACGCPVVVSRTGACPEITAGAGLLASPYSAEDFANKILQMLSDEGLRRDLRCRGLDRVAFFRGDRSAALVLQRIQEIVT